MNTSLSIEQAWLTQMSQAVIMGVAMIDKDGQCVQHFANDPALRELILNYQMEKIRQLELDERLVAGQADPKPYPILEKKDMAFVDDAEKYLQYGNTVKKSETDPSG